MADRPLRFCDVCGGLDDHPRHVQAVPVGTPAAGVAQEFLDALGDAPAGAVALLMSPTSIIRHMDCCAAQGCVTCQETETANNGRRGQELIDHLEATRG